MSMVYHGVSRQDIAWIESAVREGVTALYGRLTPHAGLYLPSLATGADAVALFGGVRNLADT